MYKISVDVLKKKIFAARMICDETERLISVNLAIRLLMADSCLITPDMRAIDLEGSLMSVGGQAREVEAGELDAIACALPPTPSAKPFFLFPNA